MSTNKSIAEIFYQIAEILELKGQVWESRAYQKAARTIEMFSKDVSDIYKEAKKHNKLILLNIFSQY